MTSTDFKVIIVSLTFLFASVFVISNLPVFANAEEYFDVNDGYVSAPADDVEYNDPVEEEEYTDPLQDDTSEISYSPVVLAESGEPSTDTGTDIIEPGAGDIIDPGDGELASDNRVTIGGLDFGGFTVNVGELSGNRVIEVASSLALPAAEGLKASLENVFGSYSPRMETVTYYGSDGANYTVTRQVSGIAGVDVEWIATVILYGICLYSFFRILGMVINRC